MLFRSCMFYASFVFVPNCRQTQFIPEATSSDRFKTMSLLKSKPWICPIKTVNLLKSKPCDCSNKLQTDEQSWACKQVCLTHRSTLFQCLCQNSNSANDKFFQFINIITAKLLKRGWTILNCGQPNVLSWWRICYERGQGMVGTVLWAAECVLLVANMLGERQGDGKHCTLGSRMCLAGGEYA